MTSKVAMYLAKLRVAWLRFRYRETVYHGSRARLKLEYDILTWVRSEKQFQTILLVGIARFTEFYPELLNNKAGVTSIDSDPALIEFRGKVASHIVDSIENIRHHFEPNSLDLVLMNGVYGWGLNDALGLEAALAAVYDCLRRDGLLIFGWNDDRIHDPLDLRAGDWFQCFRPYRFGDASELAVGGGHNHVINFVTK